MTKTEHERKLIKLKWMKGKAVEFKTKIYDEEIYWLSNEIDNYKEIEPKKKQLSPSEMLKHHWVRTGLKKYEMADKMGMSKPQFSRIINNNGEPSIEIKDKIMNFNYNSL